MSDNGPEVTRYLDWNAATPRLLADDTYQVSIYADHKVTGWAIFLNESDAAEFHDFVNGPLG